MARISARCPACGAGLGPAQVNVRAFRCPGCSIWLRVPIAQDLFRGLVVAVLAGLIVYGLGLRGITFLFALGAAFLVLGNPVCVLLDRLLPLRPERSWPDTGTLGLGGGMDRQRGPRPPGVKEGQGVPEAGSTPETPRQPPPQA